MFQREGEGDREEGEERIVAVVNSSDEIISFLMPFSLKRNGLLTAYDVLFI